MYKSNITSFLHLFTSFNIVIIYKLLHDGLI